MGNLERLDEKMSGENEKGEAECVLEPSAGVSVKVVARGGAVGSTEQESCVEENVVVSQEIEEEKNDNVQHATATATEEKKPNLEGTDSDEGDKEEMDNAIEDGGYMSVKEEESGLKAENCESLSSAKVDGDNLVVFKLENGEKDLENTKVGKVEPKGNNPEEMPADQDNMENEHPVSLGGINGSLFMDAQSYDGDGSGTEEEQVAFMKELENFHKEMNLEFKPPKFYGEGLNCLKLWRQVIRLGGYEQVTSCKLWRQVGESFNPPKTCTTISWSFRCFYEKALLEYEKHKVRIGELGIPISSFTEPVSVDSQLKNNQSSGSGRTIRDAAARAMQGWHTQRLLGNGEVGDPIIKDKSSFPFLKHDKQLKSPGIFKRKKAPSLEHSPKAARTKVTESQMEMVVVDVGPPADWVKINVRKTKDCFEVYALVPGLLREEVHVQSDPAGRLVISGEPEQLDNPWGVTPFKKIVTLPSRIDPHQTSAVVTLHGQLFVRAPFEQLEL